MTTAIRWTSSDLETLPDDGKRHEIIDGELHMSRQPHYHHQVTCVNIVFELKNWNDQTLAGEVNLAPGVIFDDDDDVAPDVVRTSRERLKTALAQDGNLHAAPELVIEVLSPGTQNFKRDRQTELKLYSQRGVEEYWILDWMSCRVEAYRRDNLALHLIATLLPNDTLESPLLPGFACRVGGIFEFVV